MRVIQALSSGFKNTSDDIKNNILRTYEIIFKNGWKLNNQYQQYSLQKQQSSSSQSQSLLQDLLNLPLTHPYISMLEQQQIINIIYDNILDNGNEYIYNKSLACSILNILYPDGIILTPNYKLLIIKQFSELAKSDIGTTRYMALKSLSQLAVNNENHEAIIAEGGIQTADGYIKKEIQFGRETFNLCLNSAKLILQTLIFGAEQTQQLVKCEIKDEVDDILRNKEDQDIYFVNETRYILDAYVDLAGIKRLMKLQRIIKIINEDEMIELIKAGLIDMLKQTLEKAINEDQGEAKFIFIGEIIQPLIKNNTKVSRMIIDETDFIENYLHILNTLQINQINKNHLQSLISLSQNLPSDQNIKIFQQGVSQSINYLLDSDDEDIKKKVCLIISQFIKAGLQELKEGQQHPFLRYLQDNGTVAKLIQLFQDQYNENYQQDLAIIFAQLFKATQLPNDIKNNVIKQIKEAYDLSNLVFIAEYPDNIETLMLNNFERNLFRNDYNLLDSIYITLFIIRNGPIENKKKIALITKQRIEQLTINEYVESLKEERDFSEDKIQEIKSKAQEILPLIRVIEEQIELEGEYEEINGANIINKENIVQNHWYEEDEYDSEVENEDEQIQNEDEQIQNEDQENANSGEQKEKDENEQNIKDDKGKE